METSDGQPLDLLTVLRRAKELAMVQGRLGDSPADRQPDSALHLCAASCVAQAALEETHGVEAASAFRRRVASENKFDFLPRAFAACGLAPKSAVQMIQQNDARSGADRLAWFLTLRAI